VNPSKSGKSRISSTWQATIDEGKRNELTRERIVQAGLALADRGGLGAVSIRRIAAELGSSPMALYHHVPSKRDLLNLIHDELSCEMRWAAGGFSDWRSTLGHFAHETRDGFKRHPWAASLRASDIEYGPECIRTLEKLLESLLPFGLDMKIAARALGVLFVFVNGFVAAETANVTRHAKHGRVAAHQPRFSEAILKTGRFPNTARFVEMGDQLTDDEGFERALNWILDGIEAELHTRLQPAKSKRTA